MRGPKRESCTTLLIIRTAVTGEPSEQRIDLGRFQQDRPISSPFCFVVASLSRSVVVRVIAAHAENSVVSRALFHRLAMTFLVESVVTLLAVASFIAVCWRGTYRRKEASSSGVTRPAVTNV